MVILFSILKRFWPVLLAGLVIFYIVWQINSVLDERDEAIKEVARRDQQLAIEKGKAAQSKEQGLKERKQREEQYSEDLRYAVNSYLKEFSHDKKQDQKAISDLRTKLTDSLRTHALRSSSDSVKDDAPQSSQTDGDSTVAGQEETDLTEYVRELETAGAICAADYNACKHYVDDENTRLGVESLVE